MLFKIVNKKTGFVVEELHGYFYSDALKRLYSFGADKYKLIQV